MKREELEVSGEEATKYRKEPSPCPICGKVRDVNTQDGGKWLVGWTPSRFPPPIYTGLLLGILEQDL